MFQRTIKPILLYGSEVWGFGNLNILEQVQLKFRKHILNKKKSTPNCIVYGETGVLPLKVGIQCRMISYRSKLVCPVLSNLSTKLYLIAETYIDGVKQNTCFKLFEEVRKILISCGNIGFWDHLNFPN